MNKKSELFTIGMILLALLSMGIFYYEGKAQSKNYKGYVGDISNNTVYYINTNSPNCNFNEIKIESSNLKFFDNLKQAKSEGFVLSKECS